MCRLRGGRSSKIFSKEGRRSNRIITSRYPILVRQLHRGRGSSSRVCSSKGVVSRVGLKEGLVRAVGLV